MAHRRFNIQSIICFAFGIGLIFPSDAQAQFEGIDPATSTIDHAIVLARDEETPPESPLGLEVFPNPVMGKPTLRLATDRPGTYLIEIFDVLGRRQFATREFLNPGSVEERRDLWSADSPSGVYFISITAADGTKVVRKVTLLR